MEDTSFPGERIGHVAVQYQGYMIIWGGYRGYNDNLQTNYLASDELWIYDPEVEKWSRRMCTAENDTRDVPGGTSGAVSCVINDMFYLYGGFNQEGNSGNLYRLNLKTMKWKLLQPSGVHPLPCDKSACWEYNGKLYIFGGYGPTENTLGSERPQGFSFVIDDHSNWLFRRGWNNQLCCYDPVTNAWSWPKCKGTFPMARAAHVATKVENKIYIFGGRHGLMRMNDLFYLDCDTMTWNQVMANRMHDDDHHIKVPGGRSWHSLTAISEEAIILYGGFSQDRKPLSDCWLLYLPSMTWTEIELPFDKPRLWHTAVVSSFGEVLIFGGGTQNILNYTIRNIYAGDVITIRLKPKSLFRLSLDVALNEDKLRKHWPQLPVKMQSLLHCRHESLMTNSAGS